MSRCAYGRVGVDFLVADSRQSGTAKRQKSSDAKLERDGWVDGYDYADWWPPGDWTRKRGR